MLHSKRSSATETEFKDRRNGSTDRRIGVPDRKKINIEHRKGLSDRRMPTNDRDITVVTSGGEYKGTINLNSAPVMVERVSDFFAKSDISFLSLYNTTFMGKSGKTVFLNVNDIAVVIQPDNAVSKRSELRHDAIVTVRLRHGLGQINGKVNLMGETKPVDRDSDLLNYPGKRWLVVFEASFKGMSMLSTIINMDFISMVSVEK